jgi:cysteine-rich repeat protein
MGSTAFLKIAAIWLLLQSIFTLIFGTIAASISTVTQILGQILGGRIGIALLGLITLWFGSYVVQANQTVITNGIDKAYCATQNPRQDAFAFASAVFPQLAPFICLWDWGLSFTSFAVTSFITTAFPCVNYQSTIIATKDLIGTILQSVITFLFFDAGPIGNKFDFASIFAAWANFIDTIRPVAECVCNGIIDLYDFIIGIVTDDNLGCGIDQTIATITQFLQNAWNVFFNNLVLQVKFKPSLTYLNSACSAFECFGDFFDNTIQSVFDLFVPGSPNLRLGCIVARLVCLVLDIIFMASTIAIEIAWDSNFDIIIGVDFTALLEHLTELGECAQAFFRLFDPCLGQVAGSLVFLIRDFIKFGVQLLQDGIFEFELISRAVKRLVGQATYGNGRHVGRSRGHDNEYTQTGLTCLVSLIFEGATPTCGSTYGDLVNAFLEALLIPLELVQAVIDNVDLLAGFEAENPVSGSNRAAFSEFLNAILNVIVDRLFGIFDYTAHILQCPPILEPFGNALVGVVKVLRMTWDDVQSILVTLIELIFQSVVLLFTLFGADLYGDFSMEVKTWVEIFIDILLIILEVLFEIFITLVDYILFPYFPRIFGQKSLLTYTTTTNPPVATFTACIADFAPDCICGLTLALANELCLPAGLGCLGDLWPGCGKFQTTPTSDRRREYKWDSTTGSERPIYHAEELPYEDVFDYFATEFGTGFCGSVFINWKNAMQQNQTMGELDTGIYIACLGMIRVSANFGNQTDVKSTTRDGWLMDASKQTLQSFGALFVNQAKAAITYETTESCILDDGNCNVRATNIQDDFDKYGINNPIARDIGTKTADLIINLKAESLNVLDDIQNTEMQKPELISAATNLLGTTWEIGTKSWAVGRLAVKNLQRAGVWDNLATTASTLYTWSTTQDWTTYQAEPRETAAMRMKRQQQQEARHHNEGEGPQKEWLPNFDNATSPELNITASIKGVMFRFKFDQFSRAVRAWAGLAFGTYMYAMVEQQRSLAAANNMPLSMYKNFDIPEGNPYDTVAPFAQNYGHYYQGQRVERRGIWKDIHGYNNGNSSYPYSPIEVGKVHTGLQFIYGTGGYIRFANHIPDSCTSVGLFCTSADPSSCPAFSLFENFGLCQDFIGGYSIVTECSSINGNVFQAFAVYTSATCETAPVIVVFANATSPNACKRLTISGNSYWFCVTYTGCQACPVDQVIPGFECALLDQWFHRTEEFGKICLAEFLGVKTIDFSLNFTTPIATAPDIFANTASVEVQTQMTPTPTPVCTNVCGNGILEPCEECDDMNRFSNDGCSYPTCRIEKCPTITVTNNAANRCTTGAKSTLSQPSSCINVGVFGGVTLSSVQISCIPARPIIYYYPFAECTANSEIERVQVSQPCASQASICLLETITAEDLLTCQQFSGAGTDLTCTRNCAVCGNGIREQGEECDSNPYLSTTCSLCLIPCTVSSSIIGGGVCRFGSLEGTPCVGGYGITPVCNGGALGQCIYDNCFDPLARKRDSNVIDHFMMLSNYSHQVADQMLRKRDVIPDAPAEFVYNHQSYYNYAIVQKSNSLTTWIEPVFNEIYNFITNGDGNVSQTIANKLLNSVGNVDFALTVPVEERSFLWYPVFAFWCRVPGNLVGQVGLGLWDGTIEFIKWTAIVFVIAGIIYTQLPSFLILILMLFGPSIWWGLTFGYSYPGCALFASPPLVRLPSAFSTKHLTC